MYFFQRLNRHLRLLQRKALYLAERNARPIMHTDMINWASCLPKHRKALAPIQDVCPLYVLTHTHPISCCQLCTNINTKAGRKKHGLIFCLILKTTVFLTQLLWRLLQERKMLGPWICLCIWAEKAIFVAGNSKWDRVREWEREREIHNYLNYVRAIIEDEYS